VSEISASKVLRRSFAVFSRSSALHPLDAGDGVGPELVVVVEAVGGAGGRRLRALLGGDAEVGETANQGLAELLRALLALALVLAGLLLDLPSRACRDPSSGPRRRPR